MWLPDGKYLFEFDGGAGDTHHVRVTRNRDREATSIYGWENIREHSGDTPDLAAIYNALTAREKFLWHYRITQLDGPLLP